MKLKRERDLPTFATQVNGAILTTCILSQKPYLKIDNLKTIQIEWNKDCLNITAVQSLRCFQIPDKE